MFVKYSSDHRLEMRRRLCGLAEGGFFSLQGLMSGYNTARGLGFMLEICVALALRCDLGHMVRPQQ